MHGDDLHGVLGAGLQAVDDGRLGVGPGSGPQLPLTLLRAGVEDAVRGNDALGTVPGDPQRGGVDVGEGQVLGMVHI